MRRNRWAWGQGPMGTNPTSGGSSSAKLNRWTLDRVRKQAVWTAGDFDGQWPSISGPSGVPLNASSGNNEIWRGVFAAVTPTWQKIYNQFAPASTGVVPSMPLNVPFVDDPINDQYILLPGFMRFDSPVALAVALPSGTVPGPGGTFTLTGGNLSQYPSSGSLLLYHSGVSVGGQQEIISYSNLNTSTGVGTVVARGTNFGGTSTTTTPSPWPSGTTVVLLNNTGNYHYNTFNPNGPIGDYGAYTMSPVVMGDGNAHWSYPGFSSPPSGYGGDNESMGAAFDTLPISLGGTATLYRIHSNSILQRLNRSTLPGTWSEQRIGGSDIGGLAQAIPSATVPGVGGKIYPSYYVGDTSVFSSTGGIVAVGTETDGTQIEYIAYSGVSPGDNSLIVSQRGASAFYAQSDGSTVYQATTAQAHGASTRIQTPAVAISGGAAAQNSLVLDERGRCFYFVSQKGGNYNFQFGPLPTASTSSFTAALTYPFLPYLFKITIETTPQIIPVSPLPTTFNWGIDLDDDPGSNKTSIGEQWCFFDPLNRVVIIPNNIAQWGGSTVGWFIYHVDNPTGNYGLSTNLGWESQTFTNGPMNYGNQGVFDDFRNCLWWGATSGADAGVDTYYRYAGGPTVAAASVLSLFSLTPSSGLAGISCVLAGSLFGSSQGTSVVHFGSTTAIPTAWSNTQITITVPTLPAGTYNVSVTVGSNTTNTLPFTITTNAPVITSVTPVSGPVLTQVIIAGRNFGVNQLVSNLTIGGVFASIVSWSDTAITAIVPGSLGVGLKTVVVTTVNGTGSSTFTVSPPPPTVDLVWNGLIRDRVGQGDTALAPDGALDGVFTATVHAPGGNTVTGATLLMANSVGTNLGTWDTTASNGFWVLGVASTFDAAYRNNPVTMGISFSVLDGESFAMFASDFNATEFVNGNVATLQVNFSDGSISTSTVTIGPVITPPPTGLFGITLLPYGRGNF